MDKKAVYFKSASEFRQWLNTHHDDKEVLWVGYFKVSTGKPSIKWAESVKEAICFGWIDGLRKSIDEERYKIRFTPRKEDSHWSKKNIAMAEDLIAANRMQPAGFRAYQNRDEDKIARASYEQETVKLDEEYRKKIIANEQAWQFFQDLAPGYIKTSVHWVMSAKQEKTRRRRLKVLIKSCQEGKKIPMLRR